MGITLDLPDELAHALSEEANQLNLPLGEYILRVLTRDRALNDRPQTGAQLLAYWQREGVIGSRPDITDSQEYARTLRSEAERRTRT